MRCTQWFNLCESLVSTNACWQDTALHNYTLTEFNIEETPTESEEIEL